MSKSEKAPLLLLSEEPDSPQADIFVTVQEWASEEYERKQDDASNALVNSLMLYIGGFSVDYSMVIIPSLYYVDQRFWFGSPDYGRPSAYDTCTEGKSMLLAFPETVSEALANQTEASNVLVGSFLTFASLLILACKVGNPSVFPIPSGHFKTIFNFLRVMAPVIATFFVPRVFSIGPRAEIQLLANTIINFWHGILAAFTFVFAPLIESIAGGMDLFSFFKHKPIGDNHIPALSEKRGILDTLYKALWVATTVARTLLAVSLVYIALAFIRIQLPTTGGLVATDACGALKIIKTFTHEKTMIGLLGGYYCLLAVSQMCESSGRRLSSLIYILPLLWFALKGLQGHGTKYLMTYDLKTHYLAAVDIPASGFWEDPSFNNTTPGFEKCTALLDITTVPDNCFD